jgi:hypothetical protein
MGVGPAPAHDQNPGQPKDCDEDGGGREPARMQRWGQLTTHDGNGEDGDDQPCSENEAEARGTVGQWSSFFASSERVQCDENERLDGDAAEHPPSI